MLHKPVEELCAHACACYLIKLDIYLAGKVGGSWGGGNHADARVESVGGAEQRVLCNWRMLCSFCSRAVSLKGARGG